MYCPYVLPVLSVWLLKESADWQSNKGLKQQPNKLPVNSSIFSAAHRTEDLITGSIIFGTMLIGLWAIFSWLPTWIQSLVTTGDAQQQRGISMMMLGMGGLAGGFLIRLVNQCHWPAQVNAALLWSFHRHVHHIIQNQHRVLSLFIYAEILVLALFFGASQGVLSVYIPYLFPVSIRGTATGFCFNIGRLFTATAVLFVGVLVTELGGYGNSLFVFSMVFPRWGAWLPLLAKDKAAKEADWLIG